MQSLFFNFFFKYTVAGANMRFKRYFAYQQQQQQVLLPQTWSVKKIRNSSTVQNWCTQTFGQEIAKFRFEGEFRIYLSAITKNFQYVGSLCRISENDDKLSPTPGETIYQFHLCSNQLKIKEYVSFDDLKLQIIYWIFRKLKPPKKLRDCKNSIRFFPGNCF